VQIVLGGQQPPHLDVQRLTAAGSL
jgi:hypothetical protein